MTDRIAFGTRLTLAYTAILALAVVLLGAVAFITVRVTLEGSLETRLATTAKALRSIVDVKAGRLNGLDAEDREQLQDILGQGVNGVILDGDGALMASNLAAPPGAILRAIANPANARGTVTVNGNATSYVAIPVEERGIRYGTTAAWESRSAYDDASRSTVIALALAGCIVIGAAAAAGGMLTRRMLRPVTELSAMISEIEATDLGERLAWTGPNDELGKLCMTFDRLLDRLESAFEGERRFIADASHELRTPLSVMRAEVELALMQDRTPEAYRAALERLQRETQRLETLAKSLILTTRDDADTLPMEPSPALALTERAVARMQPLARSRSVLLTCTGPAEAGVLAHTEMLERTIVALIDNALRFARNRVTVSIDGTPNSVCIVVGDDGPGFSEAALRNATNRFWRDDPSRSGPGTGLGLAIARSIVESHGGAIELRNAEDGGAVVVIALPALQAAAL